MKGEIELYNISFLILKVELHFKNLRMSSDASSEEKTTPVKKPRLDMWIEQRQDIPVSRRVVRIAKRTRHTPLPDSFQENQPLANQSHRKDRSL